MKETNPLHLLSKSMQENAKLTQTVVGVSMLSLFLFLSVFLNNEVFAKNEAAGYGGYGYYGGTYGYGYSFSTTFSDALPAAPSSLATSNVSTTSITLSWTAPTLTTSGTAIAAHNGSTSDGSIASYKIAYSTGTVSSCTSGTTTTSTSPTVNLTSLDSNTTYNVEVCGVDNNGNTGLALSSTFTTSTGGGSSSGSGGGGSNGSSVFSNPSTTTVNTSTSTTTTPTVSAPSVIGDATALTAALGITRNTGLEKAATAQLTTVLKQTKVSLSSTDKKVATNFIAYGVDAATVKLGVGERKNLLKEELTIFGKLDVKTLTELASGQKPSMRNIAYERKQVKKEGPLLVKVLGHAIDFKDPAQDLAHNCMLYPCRFPARDLKKEGAAAKTLQKIIGHKPATQLEWSAVRAIAYTGIKVKGKK